MVARCEYIELASTDAAKMPSRAGAMLTPEEACVTSPSTTCGRRAVRSSAPKGKKKRDALFVDRGNPIAVLKLKVGRGCVPVFRRRVTGHSLGLALGLPTALGLALGPALGLALGQAQGLALGLARCERRFVPGKGR